MAIWISGHLQTLLLDRRPPQKSDFFKIFAEVTSLSLSRLRASPRVHLLHLCSGFLQARIAKRAHQLVHRRIPASGPLLAEPELQELARAVVTAGRGRFAQQRAVIRAQQLASESREVFGQEAAGHQIEGSLHPRALGHAQQRGSLGTGTGPAGFQPQAPNPLSRQLDDAGRVLRPPAGVGVRKEAGETISGAVQELEASLQDHGAPVGIYATL